MENELLTQALKATAAIIGGLVILFIIITLIYTVKVIRRERREKRLNDQFVKDATALIYTQETGEIMDGFIFTGSAKNAPEGAEYMGNGQWFVKY